MNNRIIISVLIFMQIPMVFASCKRQHWYEGKTAWGADNIIVTLENKIKQKGFFEGFFELPKPENDLKQHSSQDAYVTFLNEQSVELIAGDKNLKPVIVQPVAVADNKRSRYFIAFEIANEEQLAYPLKLQLFDENIIKDTLTISLIKK